MTGTETIAAAVAVVNTTLADLSEDKREKIVRITISIALEAAGREHSLTNAAGDFWVLFLELFKLLLPLILELFKGD